MQTPTPPCPRTARGVPAVLCPATRAARPFAWMAALAVLAGAALLAGCEPREHVPRDTRVLLPSETDRIEQRRLTLPNGMQVLLVSNPAAQNAGAALSLGVGSRDDPPEMPGLLHFMEHMLFLGTERYPEPDAYQSYVNQHGGSTNAYTAHDHTNYFFQVSNEAFEGALDRFSQFFVAPLFNPDYVQREKNAVQNEHAKNTESDTWRIRQAFRAQMREGHPMAKFSTGTLETLQDVGPEDLRRFYEAHYSANLMRLAVVGQRGLDDLERLVREKFGPVPNREVERSRYTQQYLPPAEGLRLLRVRPLSQQRTLEVHFSLPPVDEHFRAKPLHLLAYVLGHEGEGSLLSLLKAENLANSLSAGGGERTPDYASLEIRIGLTEQGRAEWQRVLRMVMGAIEGLRREGVPRALYEDNRRLADLEYHWRQPRDAVDMARWLAALMQSYPLEALPRAAYVFERYAPELYREMLGHLTLDNALVTLVAQDVETDSTERWYGTEYSYTEQASPAYEAVASAAPPEGWHLPAPNSFIPARVSLRAPQEPLKLAGTTFLHLAQNGMPERMRGRLHTLRNRRFDTPAGLFRHMDTVLSPAEQREWLPRILKDALPVPQSLLDEPRAKVWYQPNWRLRQPRARLLLKLYTADASATPRQVMLSRLYAEAVLEGLNEAGYPIRQAGLSYDVQAVPAGIALEVGGWSAGIRDVLRFLAPRLDEVTIDEATFASIVDGMRRSLASRAQEAPHRQSQRYLSWLLERPGFTTEALQAALEEITLADVQAHAREQFRRTYAEGFALGNLPPDEARAAVRDVLQAVGGVVLPPAERLEESVRELEPGANAVFTRTVPQSNSLVHAYYQAAYREPELRGALLLAGTHMQQAFYNELRTNQQLGYLVWAGMGEMRRMLNLMMLVQSGQYGPDTLLERLEAFVPQYVEQFRGLPDPVFENLRRSVIQRKLERPNTLEEQVSLLFWRAFRHEAQWDHVSTDIAAVQALEREEVEATLARFLTGDDRARLVIRLAGQEHEAQPLPDREISLSPEVQGEADAQ